MIVWVFFQGGAGGDGFANLLEHSSNAVTIDGDKKWRIHRYVDSQVKFWAPTLKNTPERINTVNQLSDSQIQIAQSKDRYLIITSHDTSLIKTFDNDIIPFENHIKILLEPTDRYKQLVSFRIKNLIEFNPDHIKSTFKSDSKISNMDYVADLDKILNDWVYTKSFVTNIGLKLSKKAYLEYKNIVLGHTMYNTSGIEYYKSMLNSNNIIVYEKIN